MSIGEGLQEAVTERNTDLAAETPSKCSPNTLKVTQCGSGG